MTSPRLFSRGTLTACLLLAGILVPPRAAGGFETYVEGRISFELRPDSARWRVDDGAWLPSGAELSGLSQGRHLVEFEEVEGWDEPGPSEIYVQGGGPTTLTADYDPRPTYVVGEIPPQIVRHGERASFYVESSDRSPVSIDVSPAPAGDVSFEGGYFRYVPDVSDRRDFSVTFEASSAAGGRQTVTVSPQPRLETETSFIDYRFSAPEDDSGDYTSITVRKVAQTEPPLNGADELNELREVEISGKTVVLRPGHPGNLYERFAYRSDAPVKDVTALNIYAETLVVAAAVRFPQTRLTIYAREILFEDGEGSPSSISTEPVGGGPFGAVTIFAGRVVSPGDAERFVAGPAPDLSPDLADALCPVDYAEVLPGLPPIAVRFSTPAGKPAMRVRIDVSNQVPTPVGFPPRVEWTTLTRQRDTLCAKTSELAQVLRELQGGGEIRSNVDLEPIVRLGSMVSVTVYDFRYVAVYHVGQLHQATLEESASTSDVDLEGVFTRVDAPLAWAHPFLINAAIDHARDAYLLGDPDVARQVIAEYLPVLDEMLGFGEVAPPVPEPLQDVASELETVRAELLALKERLDAGLDYFGNPPGWVPMLSFELNFQAFRGEIESAIKTLYLTTWLGNKAETIQDETEAMTEARARTVVELARMREELNEKRAKIPGLRSALGRVNDRIEELREDLAELDEELQERARENVEEKNKLPWWKRALRGASAALDLFPVPGVRELVSGTVGAGLDALSRIDEPGGPRNIGDFFNREYEEAVEKYSSYIDAIDPDVNVGGDPSESWGQDITNDAQELLRCQLEPVKELRRAITNRHAPASEVEAELERIRAADPAFNRVVREMRSALTEKGRLATEIQETTQRIAELSAGIVQAIQAIVELNRHIDQNLAVLDHRTLQALKKMERRVKDRLLWYQYLTAKAFQYRVLESYDSIEGANFRLDALFDEFAELGRFDRSGGHELTPEDVEALVSIYEEELRKITARILEDINDNSQEKEDSFTFGLTAEELDTLNSEGEITINLVERGLFFPDRENLRLVNINTRFLDVSPVGGDYGNVALLTVGFQHSGLSTLRREGESYSFNHLRGESATPPSWDTSYDGVTGEVSETRLSAASQSLLASLLELDVGDGTLLYLRPAADADIVIRKQVIKDAAIEDMVIDRLQVRVTYDYLRKPVNQVDLKLEVADGFRPTILVGREDLNGRHDGRGAFVRAYNRGERTSVEAPGSFGLYTFEKWVDGDGALVSEEPRLDAILDDDTTLRAVYGTAPSVESADSFRRGDANADGRVDLSDAVATLDALFGGRDELGCEDAADANDDGRVDVSDAITTLGALFAGQREIPPPGISACGADPTEDALGCERYESCP